MAFGWLKRLLKDDKAEKIREVEDKHQGDVEANTIVNPDGSSTIVTRFAFSKKSIDKLKTVDERLQAVMQNAIKKSSVDFGIVQGKRTREEQKKLVERGASQTMDSKHLRGHAVDVVGYIDDRISWEISLFDDIADAVRAAAVEEGIAIRWGAAWHIDDIREWHGTMQEAMDEYIELRRSQGRRPFIDAGHFELN